MPTPAPRQDLPEPAVQESRPVDDSSPAPPSSPAAPVRVTFTAKPKKREGPSVKHVAAASLLAAVGVAATVVMVWPPMPAPPLAPGTNGWPAEATAAGPEASSSTPSVLLPQPSQPAAQATELVEPIAAPAVPSPPPAPERAQATPPSRVVMPASTPDPTRPAKARVFRPARTEPNANGTPASVASASTPAQDLGHADDKRRVEEQNRQLDQLLDGK